MIVLEYTCFTSLLLQLKASPARIRVSFFGMVNRDSVLLFNLLQLSPETTRFHLVHAHIHLEFVVVGWDTVQPVSAVFVRWLGVLWISTV